MATFVASDFGVLAALEERCVWARRLKEKITALEGL